MAASLRREVINPDTEQIGSINAKWVQLNLSRSPDSPKLEVERSIEDWVKPVSKQAGLQEPTHPDYPLFAQTLGHIQKLPRVREKTPDDMDERFAAAIAVECKANGLNSVSHLVFSKDGQRAFAVDTPDINCEWRRRADVDVATAVQQPIEASNEKMMQVNQQLALQAQQEALQRGPEDPNRGGPKLT